MLFAYIKPIAIVSMLYMLSFFAYAEVAPRDGGSTNQAQALIQQLGAERTRLTADNAKLKKQVKDLEKELKELQETNKQETTQSQKQLNSLRGELNNKTNLSEELKLRLTDASNKLQTLIGRFRETVNNLRDKEEESSQRAQEVTRLEGELKTCAVNNVALSELGFEVLTSYENKGFWDRAGQWEPFTQLKRVQIENLVDDYKYLIEDQAYVLPADLNAEEVSSSN